MPPNPALNTDVPRTGGCACRSGQPVRFIPLGAKQCIHHRSCSPPSLVHNAASWQPKPCPPMHASISTNAPIVKSCFGQSQATAASSAPLARSSAHPSNSRVVAALTPPPRPRHRHMSAHLLPHLAPNPSLNTVIPCAGAAPAAAGRRLAPFRWAA